MRALMTTPRRSIALLGLALFATLDARAWLVPGHRRVTIEAIGALPAAVPGFFREGAASAGEAAVDPDLWRNRGTPALGDREAPEHFIDLELLKDRALPERRSDYQRLLVRLDVEPGKIGAVPYAIVEQAERLALCFAEHRRWPADPGLRSKCLLIAGWLSHFAADLTQPLHTTVHHDGRVRPDGRSPESGIHRKVDALLVLAQPKRGASGASAAQKSGPSAGAIDNGELWPMVRRELEASHALVDAVYALEPKLASASSAKPDADLLAFAAERERAAVRFVAGLFLWSWERSAKLELPDWLER